MNNLRTGAFQHEKKGTTSRVFAEIDGFELWFESDDIELAPSTEALATLWLIPALLSERNLEISEPVCSKWLDNAHKVINFLDFNWGAEPVKVIAEAATKKRNPSNEAGLFFSAGVDSFFTYYQLSAVKKPDYLINIETFDVPADEPDRSKTTRARLERVTSQLGCRLVTIRTNAKKHPTFEAHWIADTHAALLAAAGHLLTPYIVSTTIAPTWHKDHHLVNGSNWKLDPLWSSADLEVIHGDGSVLRLDRVRAIADKPLVQENLQVCFEMHNCSRCEKCVRTMLDLYVAGKLQDFKVFDQTISISAAIDSVPRIKHADYWTPAFKNVTEPEVERALRHLFRRTVLQSTDIEAKLKERRYIDEQFPKLQEGLNNALHHYSLLQEEHERLAADYAAIAGSVPIRNGLKLVRKVAKKLRASGKKTRSTP